MYLIDTSIWIDVFRDQSNRLARQLRQRAPPEEIALCRFTQMELLQGAYDQAEWELLDSYLDGQRYLEMTEASWRAAARLYFELRRKGMTVRSTIDCCIAQLAIENDAVLLHRDRDFGSISNICPLAQEFIDWEDRI